MKINILKPALENSEKFFDAISGGKQSISFSINKEQSKKFNKGSIFILDLGKNRVYISYLTRKTGLTTIEDKIFLRSIEKLDKFNEQDWKQSLSKSSHKFLVGRENNWIYPLTTKLAEETENYLRNICENFDNYINGISNIRNDEQIMESDAINFVMSIADVDQYYDVEQLSISADTETELENFSIRLREDLVITNDVYDERLGLTKDNLLGIIGKVVFSNEKERLSIFSANKTPLERSLGVDIIYINEIQNNIVAIQCKMLEKESDHWVYRPDEQLKLEIERMNSVKNVLSNIQAKDIDDFRLNSDPFFMRFIKRNPSQDNKLISYILSLEHYLNIMKLPIATGRGEGKRLTVDMLNKRYLGKQELEGLIRSGYIGTYTSDTNNLKKVIEDLAKGMSGSKVVIAFKEKISVP